MAKFETYSLTAEGLSETGNISIDMLLHIGKKNNIITEEQFKELCKYKVVVAKPSMWKRLFTKLTGDDEQYSYYIVKLESLDPLLIID